MFVRIETLTTLFVFLLLRTLENSKNSGLINFVIFSMKYFIFQYKVQHRFPHFEVFINVLNNRIEFELQIALKHDELHKFPTKYELLM